VLDSKGATKISLPCLMQTFRLTNTYLRNGSNLLKVTGNEPTMSATAPRTTATIAVQHLLKDLSSCISSKSDHFWSSAFSWIWDHILCCKSSTYRNQSNYKDPF